MENHSRKNSFVKKFMSVFLSLAVMVGVVSASGLMASAEDSNQDITDPTTGLVYSIDGNNAKITWFNAPTNFNGNLIIPETLGGKAVTETRDVWENDKVTSVTISKSVTSIGEADTCYGAKLQAINVDLANTTFSSRDGVLYSKDGKTLLEYPIEKPGDINIPTDVTTIGRAAFAYSEKSAPITIPSSVTSIGDAAFFDNEHLPSITIPSSVKSIGYAAFKECIRLEGLTIPNSVETIGKEAFVTCAGLTEFTIPSSVTSIGDRAFDCCNHLTKITVDPANKNYSSQDGVLYSKDGKTLLLYPCEKSGVATIPNQVTSKYMLAFSGCENLSSITIPSSVTSIGECAFGFCTKLTSVTFAGQVNNIGDYAFQKQDGSDGPLEITFTVPLGTKTYYQGILPSKMGMELQK